MNFAQTLQIEINRVSATAIAGTLGMSVLLIFAACAMVLHGRFRWIGVALGILALVAAEAALFVIDRQTISIRENENVTVTLLRYSDHARNLARAVMIGLPGMFGLTGLGAWIAARRRLRQSVPVLMKKGRMHLFQREYGPAVAQFTRAIRIDPFLADAYGGRGAAYQGLRDFPRALADLDEAIQRDPRLVTAYLRRAQVRVETGEIDGALADLERVLEIQPTDPELYLTRGICLHRKGQFLDAAADFHRVLKITNHTDFAEPAKEYLQRIEAPTHDALPAEPAPAALPPGQSNGRADAASPSHRAEDHVH
ncbi:MAG: tetratricopeptide repeat protein [Isosphaeraceae bacterium]